MKDPLGRPGVRMANLEGAGAEAPKKQGVSLFVLLAIVIAAALGGGFAALSGDEITDPAKFRELGPDWATGLEFGFALLIPIASVIVVWLAFFVLIFRKRGGFWKNVLIPVIMLPVVILVVLPIRIVTFTSAVDADEITLANWRRDASERIRAIRARFNEDTAEFPVVRGLPTIERASDVPVMADNVEALRARYGVYEQEIEQELQAARAQLVQLDVFEGLKLDGYAYYDRLLSSESDVQRHFDLTRQMLDLQKTALTSLRDSQGSWSLSDGRIQFHTEAGYRNFDMLMQPLFELDSDLDRVEGAMNAMLGRPGDFWPGEATAAAASSP